MHLSQGACKKLARTNSITDRRTTTYINILRLVQACSSIAFVGPVDLLPGLQQCTDELMVSYSVGHVCWMLALGMRSTHFSENLGDSTCYGPFHRPKRPKLWQGWEAEEQTHCQQQGNGLVKEIVPHVRLD